MKILFALALLSTFTTGCVSNGGLAHLAETLAKDPATVSVRVTTVYGTLYFTRTNPGTNTLAHSIAPDGGVKVGD
jgi:hypothetical protein